MRLRQSINPQNGCLAIELGAQLGILADLLNAWTIKLKESAQESSRHAKPLQAVLVKLKAELWLIMVEHYMLIESQIYTKVSE